MESESEARVRVIIESVPLPQYHKAPKHLEWKVSRDTKGEGCLWTPDPERALRYARELVEQFCAADLRLRRDGCAKHVRVLAGICPSCHLPASDCVGGDL